MSIKCFIGLHDWCKFRYGVGLKLQSYGLKFCLKCHKMKQGYAKKNHPDFWKSLGMYSD